MSDEIAAQVVTGVFTLIAAGVGWWLTAVSDVIARRRARRAALGEVLSILLEVRHRFATIRYLGRLVDRFPAEHRGAWLSAVESVEELLPDMDSLAEKYELSLSVLSQESPVLAFRLRFRDRALGQVSQVRTLLERVVDGQAPEEVLHGISRTLGSASIDGLDATIREVALAHGLLTRLRVRKVLSKTDDTTDSDMEPFFTDYLAALIRAFPSEEAEIRAFFIDAGIIKSLPAKS
jgi:hypothetical protein